MSGTVFQASTEVSVGERDGTVTVTFLRSGDLSAPATLSYEVTSESATPGVDFTGGSGSVTFATGQDQASVTFNILNDTLSEATETFIVGITTVSAGTTVGVPRTLRVNILDDENPVLPPVDPPLTSNYNVLAQTLVTGLTGPLNFEFSPVNADRIIVAEKSGVVRTFDIGTGQDLGVFMDISAAVCNYADLGLMDIAFHPDFANNPYVYAFYVADPPDIFQRDASGNRYAHVVRYTVDANTNFTSIVAGSGVIIAGNTGSTTLDINGGGREDFTDPAFSGRVSSERFVNASDPTPPTVIAGIKQNYIKIDSLTHAGGSLAFGPDGNLYVSTGDGTSFDYADPRTPDVQNLNSLSGKILRIDPITGQGLTDNPFYAGQSLDSNIAKVFQYGLRNPFSMGFDDLGRLFITETGWNAFEEINFGGPGANFGWPWYEGGAGGQLAQTSGYRDFPAAAAFYQGVANGTIQVTPPYLGLGHAASVPGFSSQAITGGSVIYDGDRYPAEFQNDFFFSNFPFRTSFTVDTNDRTQVNFLAQLGSSFAPIHYVQGPDGYVYFADIGSRNGPDGSISRLLISPASGQLVSLTAPTQVTEGVNGSVTVTFSLSAVQTSPVTVTYSTLGGTAIAGGDFIAATNATAIIAAGQTSVSVNIPIVNDVLQEPTQQFAVTINGATLNGAPVAGSGSRLINILDNDGPPPNLLVNGSLEQPGVASGQFGVFTSIPGWTPISGGSIEIWNQHNGILATAGVQFAELDYEGARDGFFQDITTAAGQTYTLSFDLRGRPGYPLTTMGVEVVWNGAVVGTVTPQSVSVWGNFTVNVTGTGGADRLTIREVQSQSTDGFGALVDNFRLFAAGPAAPTVSVSANPAQVGESAGNASVTFTLSAVQTSNVIVTWSTANGTASAGSDFTGATNATATILAGQSSVTVQIPVTDDTLAESTESFSVVLNGATLNGSAIPASGSAVISILDNEPPPPSVSVSASPASVTEGISASANIVFALSAIQASDVIVTYSTANGTASAPGDFTGATNATATILAGQSSVSVAIPVVNDTTFEPSESFSVVLNGATLNGNAITASGSTTVTIADNDPPPPNLLVNGSLEAPAIAGGAFATFASISGWTAIAGGTIELWNAHNGVIAPAGAQFAELDFAGASDGFFQDVTTSAGQSYTLTFDLRGRPGAALSSMGVEVLWNGAVVATTTPTSTAAWGSFSVNVAGTGGADRLTIREVASQGGDGLGALLDNFRLAPAGPVAPAVSIAATPSVTEGASANVTFTLNAAQASNVIVTYSTANGTASAPGDFTAATNTTATILAGQTSVTVPVATTDDSTFEPSESFSVVLNGATLNGSAIAASGSATITISDNDPPPPSTNLLVNGSLEAPAVPVGAFGSFPSISGWTAIAGGTIELWNAHNGVIAPEGAQFAELDFAGASDGFFQDVATAAGQAYTLTFDLRGRPGAALSSMGVEVVWNGVVVATTTPTTTSAWGSFSVNVTGTGSADRLTIREVSSQGGDGLGALLDNFRLVAAGPVAPAVSIAATPSVTEGASANVTFTLNAAQASNVIVTWSTGNGTASAPGDFTGASNATATILAGQTSVAVAIPTVDDTTFEQSESFSVVLNGATLNGSAIAASGSATVTISDNDPPPTGTNLLVNGSLEAPAIAAGAFASFASITGWTAIAGGTIELWNTHNGIPASNGAQFVELDYEGALDGFFQDVATTAGQDYTLTFDLRGRPGYALSTMGVEIVWNGVVVATATPTSTAAWESFTVTVTGAGGADRLTIRDVASQGGDGIGALLDNFQLFAVPPASPLEALAFTSLQGESDSGLAATVEDGVLVFADDVGDAGAPPAEPNDGRAFVHEIFPAFAGEDVWLTWQDRSFHPSHTFDTLFGGG